MIKKVSITGTDDDGYIFIKPDTEIYDSGIRCGWVIGTYDIIDIKGEFIIINMVADGKDIFRVIIINDGFIMGTDVDDIRII